MVSNKKILHNIISMNFWPTKKLGEVVVDLEKERIFTLDSDTFYTEPTISSKEHKILPKRTAKGNEFKVKRRIKLKPGDLVISKLHTQNGLFAYADREYASTTTFIPLKVKENLIDKKFLFYSLRIFIKKLGSVDTVGRETYSKEQILSLKIPVPPLPIQQKIVERLDAIKKAQELNDKQIELTEELFQSLLHRELDPKGKNWEVKKLGNVCEIARGGSPRPINKYLTKSLDGINWIKIGDVKEGEKYITSTAEKIKPEGISKTRLVQEGDLILSNSMSFGRPYILKISGAIHDGWLLLHINNANEILQDFLYYILCTTQIKIQFERFASGGVVKNLNSDLVRRVKIPLPPLETQKKIVEKLSAVQEYKKKLLDQKQKLQELFESVLNKSFKGELAA